MQKAENISSITYTTDKNLYKTLVTELIQSIGEKYSTVPVPNLHMLLAGCSIYCTVLTHLPYSLRERVDESVRKLKGYIGVFELDMGNPLHIELFIKRMIEIGFMNNNVMFLKVGYEDEHFVPDWIKDNPMLQDRFISYEEYQMQSPPLVFSEKTSERGEMYQKIMATKGKEDHYQKIASNLSNREEDFSFKVNGKLSFNNIEVPKKKLKEYALNIDHKDGKSKAKLFKDLLGITKSDWRYLAAQL